MKAASPAFQFYPKDWLSDGPVREMTHEQKGIYADLLAIYWLEGGLPSDLGRLARLTGVPVRRFEKLWEPIGRCFRIEGDRLVQKRLEAEKVKQDAFRKIQAEKGAKGGKSSPINKDRKPGLTTGETPPKPEGSFPSSVPSSQFPSPNGNGDGVARLRAVDPRTEPSLTAGEPDPTSATPEEARALALAKLTGPPSERERYAREVWDAWIHKRGRGGPAMSSAEWHLVCQWHDGQVPLRVVLQGLADCGGKLTPKTQLLYARPAVDTEVQRWRRAMTA